MSEFNLMEECELFDIVCGDLKCIHDTKSSTYKDSWRKRGELISVFGNLARKFDRLENIAKDPDKWSNALRGKLGEAIEDTVMDLAVYAILWCTYIKKNRPEQYTRALQRAKAIE